MASHLFKAPAPKSGYTVAAPPAVIVRTPASIGGVVEDRPASPLFLSVPHSGRFYAEDLLDAARLSLKKLRSSEDAFVDILTRPSVERGLTHVVGTHARCYVDLNRSANELDANLFFPPLDEDLLDHSLRVRAGLGCIPNSVGPGLTIYDTPLPASAAENRLKTVYYPYHAAVEAQINERLKHFGEAVVIDVHSMPSMAVNNRSQSGADIVLGDCWGASCGPDLTAFVESQFRAEKFKVRRNTPYAGGFACQHYGRPKAGVHVLQIEINRALYIDESKIKPTEGFLPLQSALTRIFTALMHRLDNLRSAAE